MKRLGWTCQFLAIPATIIGIAASKELPTGFRIGAAVSLLGFGLMALGLIGQKRKKTDNFMGYLMGATVPFCFLIWSNGVRGGPAWLAFLIIEVVWVAIYLLILLTRYLERKSEEVAF